MSACCAGYPNCVHGRAEAVARDVTRLAPIAVLPRSTSPGRVLRFEQPIVPDLAHPAAELSVRYETITVWEPPAELLAEPCALTRKGLGDELLACRMVAGSVLSWVRDGGMPIEEACGFIYGIYTGHVSLVYRLLTHRADALRNQQIADVEARLKAHQDAASEVVS